LAELTVGSLLYGIYLNLFLTSMYILVKHLRGAAPRPLRRSTMFVLGCALFVAVTAGTAIVRIVLNDCMMFYRLWAVWDRKMGIIVLPILTWVGLIVCSTLTAIDSWGKIITPKIVTFKPTFVFIVGLIVWKIWRITRICVPLNGTNLNVGGTSPILFHIHPD
ncbi:hypothetical protein B0H14DRAFT_2756936, partial [Mycena olivaceomarginata]